MRKVIIIGAGPAGMMAACRAAQCGASVLVLEKNEKAGKKLFLTGKGRCNLTNACDTRDIFDNIVRNPRFLYSAIYGFSNDMVMDFFEKRGCALKTERGGRVFPRSDHSSDVIRALERQMRTDGIMLRLHTQVADLWRQEGSVAGVIVKGRERLGGDAVIVATGGLSYPSTGSTGDGYVMAQKAGHRIVETAPSLVPLLVREDWPGKLQGLALKNVEASLYGREEKKLLYQGFGEMLFTHLGVSGPLILSASSYLEGGREHVLKLDLKPALTAEQLDKRLLRDFSEHQKKQFKNALGDLFPARLIPVMIRLSGIEPEKPVNEITREERRQFGTLIKNWRMHIAGTGDYGEAVITRGGVHVKEVCPSTMESLKLRGLYFAGEVLDVDALTGGFNLQIAWSTGYLAGENAALGRAK